METTDYCSYELSKALKECGFDEPCLTFYDTNKELGRALDTDNFNHLGEAYQGEWFTDTISAPTLWHAQKWLREKGIAVSVQANEIQGELWYSADIITVKGINELVDGGFDYMGYEAALSAGIFAALELIKKGE
jgi:hypothetical protein